MNNLLLFYLSKMYFHISCMGSKYLPQEIAYHRRKAKYWQDRAADRYQHIIANPKL